jgi:phage host-nuclease inhibitor protein Gam
MSPTPAKGVTAKKGVPQTLEEINAALGEYFSFKRRLKALKSRLDDRIKKIRDQYGIKMKPLKSNEEALAEAIQTSCEARRAELTSGGAKSHKFPHGTVGWRLGNWAHSITTSEAEVIDQLEKMGLDDDYVVVKKELNAERLIQDREKIADEVEGLSFTQEERFYINPPKKN